MHDSKIAPEVLERVHQWRGKAHLYDVIDGARTALLVIDMQNHWLKEGCPGHAPGAVDIVPNVNRLAAALRVVAAPFWVWACVHCVSGQPDAGILTFALVACAATGLRRGKAWGGGGGGAAVVVMVVATLQKGPPT